MICTTSSWSGIYGGGEVTRYVGRHGTSRVAKMVLLGAIPPLMLKTEANPEGLPIEPFDQIRDGVLSDRSQFYRDLAFPFYGANRDGATVSQGARDAFWLMSMTVGIKGAFIWRQSPFLRPICTQDLQQDSIIPMLILHGDDDQIVPIWGRGLEIVEARAERNAQIFTRAPHGLTGAHEQEFNKNLSAFITS